MDWFDIKSWLLAFEHLIRFFSIKRKMQTPKYVQVFRVSCILKTVETNI